MDNIKQVFKWGLIGAMLIISLVPNGTKLIPMFFSFLGFLGALASWIKDRKEGASSILKLILTGFLFAIFIFFLISRIKAL